ncbi:hypothetical protein ANN_09048 [Periplaneta americana]|uniref:Uncharacterized protein n=1 Tax=Periplaneta americana TaxID=6978 RepID=A0ABQ8TKR1_PERAM|nr:hypothetical protein ANN_09048 [Periplaneta americana]
MKRLVYETPIDTAEDLVARVVEAAHVIRDNVGLFERCRYSIVRRLAYYVKDTDLSNEDQNQLLTKYADGFCRIHADVNLLLGCRIGTRNILLRIINKIDKIYIKISMIASNIYTRIKAKKNNTHNTFSSVAHGIYFVRDRAYLLVFRTEPIRENRKQRLLPPPGLEFDDTGVKHKSLY